VKPITEEVLENDVQNVLSKVEFITVDSAGDEILASELLRGNSVTPKDQSMTPTLGVVIRDTTHGARRHGGIYFNRMQIIHIIRCLVSHCQRA